MPIIEWVTSAWSCRVITVCGQDKSQWFFLNWLFSLLHRHFCWSIFWVKNYDPALTYMGFPGGSVVKESAFSAADMGDVGLIPGLGRSSREGNGNPLQYYRLKNPMYWGSWQATVYTIPKDRTQLKQLSTCTHIHKHTLTYTYKTIRVIEIKAYKLTLIFYFQHMPWMHSTWNYSFWKYQIRSVAESCLTLCDPTNRSTPGLPVHHQLPEFTQTHVHRISDAVQPSHPLSAPSPLAPSPSQHQGLFQWVISSHEVAKVLEFQL